MRNFNLFLPPHQLEVPAGLAKEQKPKEGNAKEISPQKCQHTRRSTYSRVHFWVSRRGRKCDWRKNEMSEAVNKTEANLQTMRIH